MDLGDAHQIISSFQVKREKLKVKRGKGKERNIESRIQESEQQPPKPAGLLRTGVPETKDREIFE